MKVAQDKNIINDVNIDKIYKEGNELQYNGVSYPFFNYQGGPTLNCQITSISLLENELVLHLIKTEKGRLFLRNKIFDIFEMSRNNKPLTILSFRTKVYEEIIDSFKNTVLIKEYYFIDRKKYTQTLLRP